MDMTPPRATSLRTRPSLLKRLQSGDDSESWKEFYRTYGGLIRFFALKSGLTKDEAEDVVQETAIGVARKLPAFVYNPAVCRFKTWLLNLTRWRIHHQLRKRRQANAADPDRMAPPRRVRPVDGDIGDDGNTTATAHRIPDRSVPEFGAEWDAAWENNLIAKALEKVRERVGERQFQIFNLYVTQGWSPQAVGKTLGVSLARVYMTKHRVAATLKKEYRQLEKASEKALRRPQ